MTDGFVTVPADADPRVAARHLREVGCILAKGVVAPVVIQDIAEYVHGEAGSYAALFESRLGFPWSDAARLARLVGPDTGRSLAYETLPPDMQHLVRGELPLPVRISPRLKTIAHEPALMAIVRAAVDDPIVRLHHPPSVRCSQPGTAQALVPLHQDAGYAWHLADFLTVWVPLCEINESCGGIEILPGSHTAPITSHTPRAIWRVMDGDMPRQRLVPIFCEPGDAILFGPRLLHASRANTSGGVRCSIDYRFFSHRYPTPKRYYDIEARAVLPGSTDEARRDASN